MDNEERLIVRLSSEEILFLSEIVFRGRYPSESEAVRDAVRKLIDSCLGPEEKVTILQKAASRNSLDISDFATEGDDAKTVLSNVIRRGLESDRGED
ncbi:MAG: ribbon-helix-helix domain-containing protein [archaeon]|nr:ribbon-helix-helix domain-containing protein [archaeon]